MYCIDNALRHIYNQAMKGVRKMALSNVSFRMEEKLKEEMRKTCQELGMDMTTAFVIYAKKLTSEKRIPFEVSVDPFYSDSNRKALKKSVKQIKDGKTVTKTFEDLKAMES